MSSPELPRNAVALLVGIGHYRQADRIAPLRYAARDARSLAFLVADPDVCAFPRDRVVLLTEHRARRAAVVRRLSRWLPENARGAELALIYFAGHGVVQRVGGREEGYLLPFDADADDVITHGIAMSDVARWIAGIEAAAVVVCLDCCHAGNLLPPDGLSLRGERDLQIQPALIEQLAGRGRFLIASCDRGQKSIEAEQLRHGLFTYHLLEGLRGAGDRDGDGRVSVAELFSYVSSAVSRDAREKFQREQTPWTSAIYNEDVVLATVRPGRAADDLPVPSTVDNEATGPVDPGADGELLDRLRQLQRRPDSTMLPTVFRCLAHRSEPVRQRARRALVAVGWEETSRAVEGLARQAQAEALDAVLDGLAALEAHTHVVGLLDRLAGLLRGPLRDRTLWLLDRKRLALERERIAGIFRAKNSSYEIVKVLGPGLYTGAYLARAELTGLEVVVRVLRPEYAQQPLLRSHFLELGTRAVRLVHHNLVLTREARAFPDSNLYYTVRDFVPGATLREVLEAGRRFEPLQACKILRQLLEALTPLHQGGMAHGGIKPSNVFLSRDDRVLLGDPSLPIPAGGWDLPRLAYDFRYAPPELFRAGGQLVPASDFYALGCVAHELFRGQPPFVSDSHFELIARHDRDPIPVPAPGPVHKALDGWLHRALAKQPAERFVGLDDALRGLDAVEAGFRPQPEVGPAARRAELSLEGPPDFSPTLEPGPVGPPTSVHLLREQSLMAFDGRQSLVPLTRADGGPLTGPEVPASGALPSIVPGYEVLQELGRGGMGVVYKARQMSLNRLVALKVVLSGSFAGAQQLARFRTEAEAVARLQHPAILQIFELGEVEGKPFFVMEYCGGGSLQRRLRTQPFEPRAAAELVAALAAGVQHAHDRGIIHRDLKPANILLTEEGVAKITDFGLAHRVGEIGLTHSGVVMGTPAYMAPEQAVGKSKEVGPTTDVYGLGAILYECLTGRPPFQTDSTMATLLQVTNNPPVPPTQLNPSVPRELEAITLRCLEKDPARRYANAAELADDLRRFLDGERVSAPAPTAARARKARGWRSWWPFG